MPLIEAVPPGPGRSGRPGHRPDRLYADAGCHHDTRQRLIWAKNINP
jgi:hypothetical protein